MHAVVMFGDFELGFLCGENVEVLDFFLDSCWRQRFMRMYTGIDVQTMRMFLVQALCEMWKNKISSRLAVTKAFSDKIA